ncbi:unnamed protein product, partial [Ectocarpus fasciculatus]
VVAHSGLPCIDKPYLVLGIETSCDDTGVAVVSSTGKILSNIVISQREIHEEYGGIVPNLAMQEHKKNIDSAVTQALANAGVTMSEISGVGVTQGPGLEVCLRVGVRKAQALCTEWKKPLSLVNHLEAHCLSARLTGVLPTSDDSADKQDLKPIPYPFLALLASGGHTSLVLCNGISNYSILGSTLDDALGEAFDKASRMLQLSTGSNGGIMIEKAAENGRKGIFKLPVPLQKKMNCDFSYSGLKTSFRYTLEKLGDPKSLKPQTVSDICASFQASAFRHVSDRVSHALRYIRNRRIPVSSIVVVGGVACNKELRSLIDKNAALYEQKLQVIFPPPALCTDNGVMVAWAAIEKFNLGLSDRIEDQDVFSRWPI